MFGKLLINIVLIQSVTAFVTIKVVSEVFAIYWQCPVIVQLKIHSLKGHLIINESKYASSSWKVETYRIWFCHGKTKKPFNALIFDMTLIVNFKSQWIFVSFDSDTERRVGEDEKSQFRKVTKLKCQRSTFFLSDFTTLTEWWPSNGESRSIMSKFLTRFNRNLNIFNAYNTDAAFTRDRWTSFPKWFKIRKFLIVSFYNSVLVLVTLKVLWQRSVHPWLSYV